MVVCCYVMMLDGDLPQDLDKHFKEAPLRRLKISNIKDVRISKIKSSNRAPLKYFAGKLYFKRELHDFDYEVDDDLEATVSPTKSTLSHDLGFIIFPENRSVIFYNRTDGLRYGSKILAEILFRDKKKIKEIKYRPNEIFKDKGRGAFSDVWYHGVHGRGAITATNQYGSNIDSDAEFIKKDERYGVGIVVNTSSIPGVKVAVFESGSINYLGTAGDFNQELRLRNELVNIFAKYQV